MTQRKSRIEPSKEYAREIKWIPAWSTGSPCPQIYSNGQETYLTYYTDLNNPTLVLVTFFKSHSHRFGIVNDEAASGHPLYDRGLEVYSTHIIENSTWLDEHKQSLKVHHRYAERYWVDFKH